MMLHLAGTLEMIAGSLPRHIITLQQRNEAGTPAGRRTATPPPKRSEGLSERDWQTSSSAVTVMRKGPKLPRRRRRPATAIEKMTWKPSVWILEMVVAGILGRLWCSRQRFGVAADAFQVLMEADPVEVDGISCPFCRTTEARRTSPCSHCTKEVCTSCLRSCEICAQQFCSSCSTIK